MQLYKRIIILIAALLMTSACEKNTSEENINQTTASKPKVALIMKSLANEFFVNMKDSPFAMQNWLVAC